VFFIGVLPALLIFWVQAKVGEPAIWREQRGLGNGQPRTRVRDVVRGRLLGITAAVTIMNAFTLFAWWGINLWIPGYLSLAGDQGGIGLSAKAMSGLIIFMQAGMFLGYQTFGYISDSLGRKRTYIAYLLAAAGLVLVYAGTKDPTALFLLGPLLAFFGTGYFSGFGALTAELYPTAVRATLQGSTYNLGRIASAVAPLAIGTLAQTRGFGTAFLLASGAYLAAAAMWVFIPETRGTELT